VKPRKRPTPGIACAAASTLFLCSTTVAICSLSRDSLISITSKRSSTRATSARAFAFSCRLRFPTPDFGGMSDGKKEVDGTYKCCGRWYSVGDVCERCAKEKKVEKVVCNQCGAHSSTQPCMACHQDNTWLLSYGGQ
jgi:hypothetical protein